MPVRRIGSSSSIITRRTNFQGRSAIINQPVVAFPWRTLYQGVYTSGAGSVAASSDRGGQSQHTWYFIAPGVTSIRAVFGNTAYNANSPAGEYTTGLSTLTVGMSWNSPKNIAANGWRYGTFLGGNNTISIPPGALIASDPVPVVGVVGAPFWSRTWLQIPAGGSFPLGMVSSAFSLSGLPIIALDASSCGHNYPQSNPFNNGNNTGADKRLVQGVSGDGGDGGALWISTYGDHSYGPLGIIGTCATPNIPVVAIIGDSNAEGLGDAWAELGIFQRALLAAGLTGIKLAFSGDSAYQFTPLTQRLMRQLLLEACTHAICEYPSNDIGAGQTLAQCQSSVLSIGLLCSSLGIPIWQTTLPPRTTSPQSSANLQTVLSTESVRISWNHWVRDGMPINSSYSPLAVGSNSAIRVGQAGHPFSGVFDTGALIEVNASNQFQLDGGFWYCGPGNNTVYSNDGTHYNGLAAVLMQQGITTSVFTVN